MFLERILNEQTRIRKLGLFETKTEYSGSFAVLMGI